MIEEVIPGNKTRIKILEMIYRNSRINLTSLIKKTKASPNLVLKYTNKLLEYEIIKEERIGGKKKTHIRNFEANFDNETARIIYSLIEINKKLRFFKKYKKLKSSFIQLEEIIKTKKGFVLIYGSYARFMITAESDLDVLIVGEFEKEEVKRIREVFVTIESELSLKIETNDSFLKNKHKPLYQNILKEHVVVYGVMDFMKVLI